MSEWCMAHPWMTFWLAFTFIIGLWGVLDEFAKRK